MGVASGLVASWPGIIESGVRSDAIIEYVDVVPTFLDAAGVSKTHDFDGRSFLPVLQGKSREHKNFAYSIQTTLGVNGVDQPYGIRSVVNDRFRYVLNLFPENEFSIPASRNLRSTVADLGQDERDFANRYLKRPRVELFDVKQGPLLPDKSCLRSNLSETEANLGHGFGRLDDPAVGSRSSSGIGSRGAVTTVGKPLNSKPKKPNLSR